MEVLLIKDVKNLGKAGDVVKVSDGYVKNFLLPKDLAVNASISVMQSQAQAKQARSAKLESERKHAVRFLDRIASQTFKFELTGDKNGHLYAGLKQSEILAKINPEGGALEGRLRVLDYSPIKTAGEHEVTVEIAGIGASKVKLYINKD